MSTSHLHIMGSLQNQDGFVSETVEEVEQSSKEVADEKTKIGQYNADR